MAEAELGMVVSVIGYSADAKPFPQSFIPTAVKLPEVAFEA
jgi:hypothetical protein